MKSAEEGLHICLDEKVLMEHYMFVAMIPLNVETISTNGYLLIVMTPRRRAESVAEGLLIYRDELQRRCDKRR